VFLNAQPGFSSILDREMITHFIRTIMTVMLLAGACWAATVGPQISVSEDGKTMTIVDAPEQEVFAFGKTVIVKNRVKGVSAVGGDIKVEGNVSGDVATLGGSVYQNKDAFIGGDVIVIGGSYKPEIQLPLREPEKETVVVGMFENELRSMAQEPTQIFTPTLTVSYFAQRVLMVLFWFVITFAFTTLAPGAVSRAVARVQLSSLKIAGIGMTALVLTLIAVLLGIQFLPNYLSVTFSLMTLVLLLLAYLFGRVALQLSIGKMIQRTLISNQANSETLAILFGVLFWTLLLSIPYIWTLAVLSLFVTGIGLVLTARTGLVWAKS
jgi:hypothetical protein